MASTLSRSWLPALSLLACGTVAQAAPPSDWKAKDGYYFRLESDGNVGCYSPDGVNCTWGKPVEPARTLTCGARHKAIWGDTGYVHQDHWCNVVYATFFAKWTDYRILGHDFMLSKNPEGDTMCLSKDGRLCASTSEAPRQNDWKEVRPVVCGPSSQAKGGRTGYEDPSHWCRSREIIARGVNLTNQWAGQPWSSKNGQFEMALPDWSQSVNPAFVARLRLGNWSTVRMQATASDGNALLAADFGELIEFHLPGENYASGFPSHALQGREQTLAFMETADRLYAFGSNDLNSAVLPAPASDFQSSHQQLLSYKKRNDYPAAHRRRMEGATSGSILRLIAVAPYERNVNPEVLEAVMVQDRILPKR